MFSEKLTLTMSYFDSETFSHRLNSISETLNKLALNYAQTEAQDNDNKIINTITQLVYRFRK